MSDTPQSQPDASDAPTPALHPVIIALSLVCCFPLGLLFVWGHPEWTRATKFLWTGVWSGIMLIGFVGMKMDERATQEAIAEAEQLWQRSEKGNAVDNYRHLLDAKFSSIPEEDRPLLLRRVIEFDVEQGNHEQARETMALAERKKVALSLELPEARALLAEYKSQPQASGQSAEAKAAGSRPEAGGGSLSTTEVIHARQLLRAYDNEVAGSQLYGGKTILVRGPLIGITNEYLPANLPVPSDEKRYCAQIGGTLGPRGYTDWIECFFREEATDLAAAVPSTTVTISGRVHDKLGKVVRMIDCELVRDPQRLGVADSLISPDRSRLSDSSQESDPYTESIIQRMKNAGTWTPSAERNIRKIIRAARENDE